METAIDSRIEEKNDRLWLMLRAKVYEKKVKEAFEFFRRHAIEPVLIKGWAAAIEYPLPYERFFGDVDLCVDPKDYQKSLKLMETVEGKRHLIDLHNGFRRLDTLEWEDLFANSVLRYIDDQPIRILRGEDHLRVLSVHWLNDGGADKNKLLDVYYLLLNNEKNFDWSRCLGTVSTKRANWIKKVIGVLRRYYGLELSNMPFDEDETELPDWFVRTIEKEWKDPIKLKALESVIWDRRQLLEQIRKRLPPNAIQATIEMDGEIDGSPRFYYQLANFISRLKPSVKRVYREITEKYKKNNQRL